MELLHAIRTNKAHDLFPFRREEIQTWITPLKELILGLSRENHVGDAVIITDFENRVIFMNSAAVQPTQRVQDRTTDFILGVGLKLHIVPSVEAVDGRDQAHRPG
jgi:hypothetical protein